MAVQFPLLPPAGGTPRAVATCVNLAMRGKVNATGVVTLTPNQPTTVVSDARIGVDSYIGLSPLTANAAAALATTYVSARASGSATIAHANNAQTDRSFAVLIIG
jgi:hypothetical protein